NFVFGNHRFNFICNLLIITYKGTNNKRDYQLFKCFFYPELAYDMDKEAAVKARKYFLQYAKDNQLTMAGIHLPAPAFK
ncbi:hypothetical protein NCY89_18835, partial [Bacteroides uniformis]|nr:hypothetical protein [Bacteroides uniformis]MCM1929315.1 hypothetical protein [Bacteroides uniformis]MCM1933059.1 hypothetical protein [Bacteroides uniformis]